MRIGGPPAAPAADEDPPEEGAELFAAFADEMARAPFFTLMALRTFLEQRPLPSFDKAPKLVQEFFADIEARVLT